MAAATPGAIAASAQKSVAGVQEAYGASERSTGALRAAQLQVLPQAAASVPGEGAAKIQGLAQHPAVIAAAKQLGVDPQTFAQDYSWISMLPPSEQARQLKLAQAETGKGQATFAAGRSRADIANVEAQLNQPGTPAERRAGQQVSGFTPKNIAFQTLTTLPQLAVTTAGTILGGPVGGTIAGVAAFAPEQYADVRDTLDQHVQALKASGNTDAAAELEKKSDSIAGTAGILLAASDAAGSLPLANVIARTPGAQAVLNRVMGSALSKTVGARVAGAIVANGAGGAVMGALQQGVDAGVLDVHMPLKDALKSIAQQTVVAATAGGVIGVGHELIRPPPRAAGGPSGAETLRAFTPEGAAPGKPGEASPYPGYHWDDEAGKWAPDQGTVTEAKQLQGPAQQKATAHQEKVDAVNAAAAKAKTRADVQLVPTDDGWEIHVQGKPVATFETSKNAREVLAQARKLVGSAPPETAAGRAPEAAKPSGPAAEVGPAATPEAEPLKAPAATEKQTPVAAETPQKTNLPTEHVPQDELEELATNENLRTTVQANEGGGLKRGDVVQTEDGKHGVVQSLSRPGNDPEAWRVRIRHEDGFQASYPIGELKAAAEVNPVTGMPSVGAYVKADRLGTQQPLEIAGEAGKSFQVQRAVAQALKAGAEGMENYRVYHFGDGKFHIESDEPTHATDEFENMRRWGSDMEVDVRKPDGSIETIQGIEFKDAQATHSQAARAERAAQSPPAPGGQGGGGAGTQATVLGQEVTQPGSTAAQRASGRYQKAVVHWNGLDLHVENVKGSKRTYTGPGGGKATRVMQDHYGEIAGTKAADGQPVDVFMGPHAESPTVYVIDQMKNRGRAYDEAKTMVGYRSEQEARDAYLANYQSGWEKNLGAITAMPVEAFKTWLKHGDTTKPLVRGRAAPIARYVKIAHQLRDYASKAGWAELGGKGRLNDKGENVGTTRFIPHEPWFKALQRGAPLPDNNHGKSTQNAVDKAIAGKHLGDAQKRHVDMLADIVEAQNATDEELKRLTDEELAARTELLAAIRDATISEPGKEYKTEDLFGDRSDIKNELKKLEEERLRRMREAPPPESADHPDLFNSGSKQRSLFSPRRAYSGQLSLDFAGEAPKADFATRPDTTRQDVERGVAALRGLLPAQLGRKTGATVLGNRIPKEFARAGTAAFLGQKVESAEDFALLAQVARNPQFEVLWNVLVKDGHVVHVMATSARLPGASSFKLKVHGIPQDGSDILKWAMRRTGADGYYVMHNHPSGRSHPSVPDVVFTAKLAHVVPGLIAHVVIDHEQYHVIRPGSEARDINIDEYPEVGYVLDEFKKSGLKYGVTQHAISGQPWAVGKNPLKDHPLLGYPIGGPSSFARAAIASQIGVSDRAVVLGTDAENTVRALVSFPIQSLMASDRYSTMRVVAMLGQIARNSGSHRLFAALPKGVSDADVKRLVPMFQDVHRPESGSDLNSGLYRPFEQAIRTGLGRGQDSLLGRIVKEALREPYGEPAPVFYSALKRAAESAGREKGSAAEWLGTLRNIPGVKQDELDWTDLKDWLQGRGRVSKQEVVDYLTAHELELQETVHGAAITPSEWGLAQRKAIFDQYNPQIVAIREQMEGTRGREREGFQRDIENLEIRRDSLADEAYPIPEAGEPARYRDYALPGGQNYRELLLSMPMPSWYYPGRRDMPAGAESAIFRTGHWSEPNVLAHVRFDERTDAEGKKVLHLAEIQSDWHQAGRRRGYRKGMLEPIDLEPFEEAVRRERRAGREILARNDNLGFENGAAAVEAIIRHPDWRERWDISNEDAEALQPYLGAVERLYQQQRFARDRVNSNADAIPDAPFKTTWPELAFKRMLRFAVDHGFDRITWDTGQTNADRYSLAKKVKIEHKQTGDGRFYVHVMNADTGRSVYEREEQTPAELEELVGKEIAQRIVAGEGVSRPLKDYEQRLRDRGDPVGVYPAAVDDAHHVHRAAGNEPINHWRIVFANGSDMGMWPTQMSAENEARSMKRMVDEFRTGALKVLEGDDLIVGGEGMKGFYDRMLPSMVGKLVKKWGGKVGRSSVETEAAQEGVTLEEAVDALAEGKQVVAYDDGIRTPIRDQHHLLEVHSQGDFSEEPRFDIVNPSASAAVHSLDITDAMRESVLAGQAVFEPGKGYGVEEGKTEYQDEHEQTRALRAIEADHGMWASIKKGLAPATVDADSAATAAIARAQLGELAQATHEAQDKLDKFSKAFDLLSFKDRMAFIDAIEEGRPQPQKELQGAADTIRTLLDTWRDKVRDLGVGALENWIENYFPHIWQDPARAGRVFGLGRRPLQGSKSFLKQRKIPTTKEGLEYGLKSVSTNPLILALMKLREMQRFYVGVRLMEELKDAKLAVFFPANRQLPPGWKVIDDAVGRVLQYSELEGGFVIRGKYAMPGNAARVINNHLSVSSLKSFAPLELVRLMGNAATSLQLGFSAFHLGFTTLDASISKIALGVERAMRGELLGATRAMAEGMTPAGAAMNIARGAKLLQAYSNPGEATPLMQRVVQGLMAAGGRAKMDRYFYATQSVSPFTGVGFRSLAHEIRAALTAPRGKVEALTKAIGNFPRDYSMRLWRDLEAMGHEYRFWELPFELAGRVVRASSSLIMEHLVPLQKLGVFSDLAQDYMRAHPNATPEEFTRAMQSIWDSVDNRLGEMVYDNLFWNRTFQDSLHLSIRAVGWNAGTIREIGGAPVDAVKLLTNFKGQGGKRGGSARDPLATRFADAVGHRIPYVIAMTMVTATLGAMLNYLMTGEGPQETKDYFFPRTGRTNKYGEPERVSLPSYVKDIYEYSQQPGTTVVNKLNPLIGIIQSIYENEDFYGAPIMDPDKPWYDRLLEGASYAAREVLPFSIQGQKQFADQGNPLLRVAPFIGVTPAPARVTSPEEMERYQRERQERAEVTSLQRQLRAAVEAKDASKIRELRREIMAEKQRGKQTQHEIKQDRARGRAAADKISAILKGATGKDGQAQALRDAGLPQLAALWAALPSTPRPRVAAALQEYA